MQHQTYLQQVADHVYSFRYYAFRLTKNREDADDLMHDTFLKACQYEHRYIHDTNMKGWIYVIMRNIFINNLRSRRRAPTVLLSEPKDKMFDSTSNAGESNLNMQQLEEEISALKKDLTKALMLFCDGFKYREISDQLDIPIGTIKSKIHNARKQLKESIVR